ncbi:uncharacterized protein Dana_GF10545 [Drosophila ananassae]|uniref:Uncharacterized protein n=2 Tax=Drosophila ananassae TaxID=7217 RepID=B3M4T4_DROAN|nr:uncharacterized protein Dana_GF10545 [Drosophila ananassae]
MASPRCRMAHPRTDSQPGLQLLLVASLVASTTASLFASLPDGGVVGTNVLGLMPGQQVLAAVPASERVSFLLYQLALAINSAAGVQEVEEVQVVENQEQFPLPANPDPNWLAAMANEFQNVPVYESFPMDLRNWLMDSFGVTTTDVLHSWNFFQPRQARTTARGQLICTNDGQCFEVNKIVTACCPF